MPAALSQQQTAHLAGSTIAHFSKRCAFLQVSTETSCSFKLINDWAEALKDLTTAVGDFWRCTVRCPLAPTSAASSKSCQPCSHTESYPNTKAHMFPMRNRHASLYHSQAFVPNFHMFSLTNCEHRGSSFDEPVYIPDSS